MDTTKKGIMMELKQVFERFVRIPFPLNNGKDPVLQDLFVQLIDYDGFVCGLVTTFLETHVKDNGLKYDDGLERKLKSYIETADHDMGDFETAVIYLGYLFEIKLVLNTVA